MDPLYWRALIQGILGTILFIALIFWPAGTFHYWQGWLFLAVFSASTIGFTIYLALYDKPLLERRLAAGPQHEKERSQKIVVSLIFISFFALIVLPALDHRYGWSPVPPSVTIAGDVLIVLSFLFIFWVIKVNSYAASNIRVEKGQKVIDTGPYAPPDVRRRYLAVHRDPTRTGSVVVDPAHHSVFSRPRLAPARRGEDFAQRSSGVHGI
jgi:protein-S-isoprenylcysteine O-methyltransferase Ste14